PAAAVSELERFVLRALPHPVVDEDEGGHGLDDDDGARDDAGVVPAAGGEFGRGAVDVHGLLRLENGGGGLEGDAEENLLAVADAALDAAGAVGGGADPAFARLERVVVLRALEERAGETAADFEALGGGKRKHGLGEVGLEAVEDRFAQAGRHALHAADDDAADGVALGADGLDALDHLRGGGGMGTAHGRGLDFGERGKTFQNCGGRGDVVDLGDKGANLNGRPERGAGLMKDFLCHRAGCDAADGFAGGATPAAPVIAQTVLGLVGEIRVRGAEFFAHLVVGTGLGGGVAHEHGQRGAGGAAFKDAGKDLDRVLLFARGDDVTLAGAAAVKVGLDVVGCQRQAGRAAIDGYADRMAVTLAPGGNGKNFSKAVRHRKRPAWGRRRPVASDKIPATFPGKERQTRRPFTSGQLSFLLNIPTLLP